MMTKQRRHSQAATRRNSTSRKSKSAAIVCSMECPKAAITVCAACERPLCEDHRVLIHFGANHADVLTLELCAECSASNNFAPNE